MRPVTDLSSNSSASQFQSHLTLPSGDAVADSRLRPDTGGSEDSVSRVSDHYSAFTQPNSTALDNQRVRPLSSVIGRLCQRTTLPSTLSTTAGFAVLCASTYFLFFSKTAETMDSVRDAVFGLSEGASQLAGDSAGLVEDGIQLANNTLTVVDQATGNLTGTLKNLTTTVLPFLENTSPIIYNTSIAGVAVMVDALQALQSLRDDQGSNTTVSTLVSEVVASLRNLGATGPTVRAMLGSTANLLNHTATNTGPHLSGMMSQTTDLLDSLPVETLRGMSEGLTDVLQHTKEAMNSGLTLMNLTEPLLDDSGQLLDSMSVMLDESARLTPHVAPLLNQTVTTMQQGEKMVNDLVDMVSTLHGMMEEVIKLEVETLPPHLVQLMAVMSDITDHLTPITQEVQTLMRALGDMLTDTGALLSQDAPTLINTTASLTNHGKDMLTPTVDLMKQAANLTQQVETLMPTVSGMTEQLAPMLTAAQQALMSTDTLLDTGATMIGEAQSAVNLTKGTLVKSQQLYTAIKETAEKSFEPLMTSVELLEPLSDLLSSTEGLSQAIKGATGNVESMIPEVGDLLINVGGLTQGLSGLATDSASFVDKFEQLIDGTITDLVNEAESLLNDTGGTITNFSNLMTSLANVMDALKKVTNAAADVADFQDIEDAFEIPDGYDVQTDFESAIKAIDVCDGGQQNDVLGIGRILCGVAEHIKDKIAESGIVDSIAELVIEEAYNGIGAYLQTATADLFGEADGLSDALEDTETSLTDPVSQLKSSASSLGAIGTSATTIAGELSTLMSEISGLTSDASTLVGHLPSESDINGLGVDIASVGTKTKELQTDLDGVFDAVDTLTGYIEPFTTKSAELVSTITTLKSDIENTGLGEKIDTIAGDLPQYEALLQRMSNELGPLATSLSEFKTPLATVQSTLTTVQTLVDALTTEVMSIEQAQYFDKLSGLLDGMSGVIEQFKAPLNEMGQSLQAVGAFTQKIGPYVTQSGQAVKRLADHVESTLPENVTQTLANSVSQLHDWAENSRLPIASLQTDLQQLSGHVANSGQQLGEVGTILESWIDQLGGLADDADRSMRTFTQELTQSSTALRGIKTTVDQVKPELGTIKESMSGIRDNMDVFSSGAESVSKLLDKNTLNQFSDTLKSLKDDLDQSLPYASDIGHGLEQVGNQIEPLFNLLNRFTDALELFEQNLSESDNVSMTIDEFSQALDSFMTELSGIAEATPGLLKDITDLTQGMESLQGALSEGVELYKHNIEEKLERVAGNLQTISDESAKLSSDEMREFARIAMLSAKVLTVAVLTAGTVAISRPLIKAMINWGQQQPATPRTEPSAADHDDAGSVASSQHAGSLGSFAEHFQFMNNQLGFQRQVIDRIDSTLDRQSNEDVFSIADGMHVSPQTTHLSQVSTG